MQSVPITTNVVSSNPTQAIQHCVIKFVSNFKHRNTNQTFKFFFSFFFSFFFNNVISFIQMLATITTPKVQAPFWCFPVTAGSDYPGL
jgi:hypothetical protein